jgi:hypothetical protein
VVALIAFWVLANTTTYGGRVSVYRAIAVTLEDLLAPVWLGVLVGLLVVVLIVNRRSGITLERAPVTLAPDVHLRTEPEGKLSVLVSDGRGALVRDFVIERSQEDENFVLERFDELARRTNAFLPSRGAGRTTRRAPRAEIEEVYQEVYALGRSIAERLLGGSAGGPAGRLVDLPGDHLLLRLQPDLARVPWELAVARPGGRFLWQVFHMSRQVRSESVPERSPGLTGAGRPARMLLLANLEAGVRGRDLPAAEEEANEIMDLASRSSEVMSVVRKSPKSVSELTMLLDQGFHVVHYASHATHGRDGAVGWCLPSGEVFSPDDVSEACSSAPVLVFCNACSSGGLTGWDESRSGEMPLAFMRQGVSAYLGTFWELHDLGSAEFALAFYREALRGSSLASSVSAARARLMGTHPFTWANYVLYGDPASTLRSVGAALSVGA